MQINVTYWVTNTKCNEETESAPWPYEEQNIISILTLFFGVYKFRD